MKYSMSLWLRIIRICNNPKERDKLLGELKEMLLERQYPELNIKLSNRQIQKDPQTGSFKKSKKK